MPLVQCDLRVGLSDEQKVDLGLGITEVFERVLVFPASTYSSRCGRPRRKTSWKPAKLPLLR